MTTDSNLSGHICLFRKIQDSSVFANEGLLKVWIWCLTSASHKVEFVPFRSGKGKSEVQVKPGQLIYGRLSAANTLKMNPNTLRTRLKKLEKKGMIKIFPKKNYSIIYITKWHIYQPPPKKKNGKKPEKSIIDFVEIDGEKYVFSDENDGEK